MTDNPDRSEPTSPRRVDEELAAQLRLLQELSADVDREAQALNEVARQQVPGMKAVLEAARHEAAATDAAPSTRRQWVEAVDSAWRNLLDQPVVQRLLRRERPSR